MAKSKSAPKKAAKAKKSGSPRKRASKTKDEAVVVAVGSLFANGDNQPKMRDLAYHYRNITDLQEQSSLAAKAVTTAKKIAKEAGVNVQALMNVKKAFKLDAEDLATMMRQQAALMSELGSPVQMALFEPKYGSLEAQAAAEGQQAAEAGRSPNLDRWPENTPGHADHLRAWNDVNAARAMKMGKPAPTVEEHSTRQ